MATDTRPFRHLNDDGLWPRFHWTGLALGSDGALRLTGLPAFKGVLPPPLESLDANQPPGGVAIDADGSVYFSDPVTGTVHAIEGCFGNVDVVPCIGGQGTAPTQFSSPAGLAIAPQRHTLHVADSGNHRVQIFDLASLALVELIDGFERPVSLALDAEGQLFVADTGTKRVDLFSTTGDRQSAFGDMVQASGHAGDPCAVACEGDRVYVCDRQTHEIAVFSPQGLVEVVATAIDQAIAFAVVAQTLYVGDPHRRRIAVWSRDQDGHYRHAGDAAGYEGPVSAIAPDLGGGLLVSPGGGVAPVRLALDASHAQEGWLWSDAITFDTLAHDWNRLHASVELPAGSHLQFFVATGARTSPPRVTSDS